MNLARTLMTDGNFDESLKLAERGLKLKNADGALRQMLLYNRAMCAVHVRDLDTAEESCWQGLAQNPDNLDLVFVLGWIMCIKERFERAVMYFHRYFALRDAQSKSGFNLLILDFWDAQPQAYHFLGDCYRRLGHSERAQECYGKAIGLRPYTPMGFKSLAGQFQDDQNPSARDRALLETVYRGIADDDIFTQLSP
jgi:tetratricopeptide (TPR) repeat protein